jgi:hypothetical protein
VDFLKGWTFSKDRLHLSSSVNKPVCHTDEDERRDGSVQKARLLVFIVKEYGELP